MFTTKVSDLTEHLLFTNYKMYRKDRLCLVPMTSCWLCKCEQCYMFVEHPRTIHSLNHSDTRINLGTVISFHEMFHFFITIWDKHVWLETSVFWNGHLRSNLCQIYHKKLYSDSNTWAITSEHPTLYQCCWHRKCVKQHCVWRSSRIPRSSHKHFHATLQDVRRN
jgi:hypothetical protein